MFIDFDKVFHPEQKWKDIKLTDRNPCVHCKVTKKYQKHIGQIRMSLGFEDEILKPCKTCKDHILWQIDCAQKLRWYEDNDERLKIKHKYCLFCVNSMSADAVDGSQVLVCFDCKGFEGREMIVGEDEYCDNYKEN